MPFDANCLFIVYFFFAGECVLALKSMFSVIPQPFETILVHGGEETGRIKLVRTSHS